MAHKIFCVVGTLGLWDSVSPARDLGLPHFYQWDLARPGNNLILLKGPQSRDPVPTTSKKMC